MQAAFRSGKNQATGLFAHHGDSRVSDSSFAGDEVERVTAFLELWDLDKLEASDALLDRHGRHSDVTLAVRRRDFHQRTVLELRVSEPSISAQIRLFEEELGDKPFQRKWRTLALTELGQFTRGYADEIFSPGSDLIAAVKRQDPVRERSLRFTIGVEDSFSKLLTYAWRYLRYSRAGGRSFTVACETQSGTHDVNGGLNSAALPDKHADDRAA